MTSFLKTGLTVVLSIGLVSCAPASDEAPGEAADTEVVVPEAPGAAAAAPARAPAPQRAAPAQPAAPAPAPATPSQAQSLAPAAPPARVFQVPEGTVLGFTLIDSLSTETSQPGDTFQASLTDALMIDGVTVIPRNALATGRVLAVDEPGRVRGLARIELAMTEIRVGEQVVGIDTVPFVAEAESTRSDDATKIGIGAGIGAAIGGLLGGGGGAAKGAAIGGGAGTGAVLATRGDQIVYPSETKLQFTLSEATSITEGP